MIIPAYFGIKAAIAANILFGFLSFLFFNKLQRTRDTCSLSQWSVHTVADSYACVCVVEITKKDGEGPRDGMCGMVEEIYHKLTPPPTQTHTYTHVHLTLAIER